MNVKTILFDSKYHPIAVSDRVYERVLTFVEKHRVCGTCGKSYTTDNLQVAENCCLACFLQRWQVRQYSLRYIGILATTDERGVTTGFLDKEGYIYLSYSWSEMDRIYDTRSIPETLRYWKFPVPQFYEVNGTQVDIHDSTLSLFGDVRNASVVVVQSSKVLFLAYSNGSYRELNRRKAETRTLFTQARERGESSKDEQGDYHIAGYRKSTLTEYDLLRLVSEVASEQDRVAPVA